MAIPGHFIGHGVGTYEGGGDLGDYFYWCGYDFGRVPSILLSLVWVHIRSAVGISLDTLCIRCWGCKVLLDLDLGIWVRILWVFSCGSYWVLRGYFF